MTKLQTNTVSEYCEDKTKNTIRSAIYLKKTPGKERINSFARTRTHTHSLITKVHGT
jgi:hypothetical protein